ncbi:MAG: hypothetical protein OEZ02_14450 [Anaerolineae bacterium]|nr:hypothetical protein [Anaerolineae bacterium]
MKPNWDANIVKVLSQGLSTKRDLSELNNQVNTNSCNIEKIQSTQECLITDINNLKCEIQRIEGLMKKHCYIENNTKIGDSEAKKKTTK